MKGPFLVQIECQMPLKGPIESFEEQCLLRLIEGGRSKVVVRFYDFDRSITRAITQLKKISDSRDAARDACIRSTGILCGFHSWRGSVLANLQEHLEKTAFRKARTKFSETLRNNERAAIEPASTEAFRLIRRNEHHELMESISRAEGIWFFIFPYGTGEILTDSPGSTIVHYM